MRQLGLVARTELIEVGRLTAPAPVFYLVRTAFDGEDRPVEICEHVMSGERWQLSYEWQAD
jgi:GntR family transcriptional regulator